ncbi:MAG: TonB-dependent receptor [Alphaproteobacteria bacterium]|nr:TonB-dependent receptor [Alphaproteobacteria bacterium]MBU1514773.1 TonB-dependent receptor [Alphaproteobacteria bacterium]MBU2093904.1 TonB-dependent receptor [Alphaproteobacteria bacterium]MBU2153331.1 TonB-dependent receptor [Alphaproteobacteria bacterium]MBU2309759.1 TonB-dependent receptor [Alphaproteobacteria bacterium]
MPDLPPPQVTDVEIVIVHPPRLAPLGGEAAFSAVVIGPEVLKTEPRLDEALKSVPGVSLFRRTGSGAANPTTQGLSLRAIAPSGAGRALVTLDGAPQNDPFGGWVIWSGLPAEGIESATIVRGAGAGPYGAGALTGVVALQERATPDGVAAAELSAGERGSYRAAVAAGAPGVLLTAAGSRTDGYYAVRGARRGAADTRLRLDDASVALRLQPELGDVQAAVRISAFQVNQEAGLRGARSNTTGQSATVTLAQPAANGVGGWRLQGWVRHSDLENSSVAVAAGRATTTPANDQYNTPATGYGLNAAYQVRQGPVAWEIGADVRLTDGTEHERFRFMNGAFTRDREAGGKTLVVGAYVEAALDEGPWLVTGGVRLDRSRAYDAVRIERDTATGAITLNQATANRSDTTPTGRIGVRYALSQAVYARAAAYAGFRAPTLNELHRPFRVGNDITEANPTLKPETLQGIEAGFGGDGGPVRWSADVFYNLLKDPITNVTIGVGPGTFPVAGFIPAGGTLRQRQNAGEIEAWGVEGEASGDLGATLGWRAAMAYTDAEVHGGRAVPQLTGLRPAQTPKWTVTGGASYRPLEALQLSADVRYESARWEDDLNSRRLSAGVQVDARAAWTFAGNAEVYIAAENLFDKKLEVGETADGVESYAAPQTIRVGFTYRR